MTLRECFYVQTAFGACLFPRLGILGVQDIAELQPWARAWRTLGYTDMEIAAWAMLGSQTRTPPAPWLSSSPYHTAILVKEPQA